MTKKKDKTGKDLLEDKVKKAAAKKKEAEKNKLQGLDRGFITKWFY